MADQNELEKSAHTDISHYGASLCLLRLARFVVLFPGLTRSCSADHEIRWHDEDTAEPTTLTLGESARCSSCCGCLVVIRGVCVCV